MKYNFKLLLGAGIMAPFLLIGIAAAQAPTPTTTVQPTTTTEDKASLQQRLEKRKSELKLKLSTAEQTRIKTKCKAAQGNVSSLKGRINGIETSRTKVYTELTERLTKLEARLKEQGLDVTKLDAQLKELQIKIDTFSKVDLPAYKQSVSDLSAMDCAADPLAFKSSLEASRTSHAKLTQEVKDIRTYVNETIKPTLQAIRAQLAEVKQQGGDQ